MSSKSLPRNVSERLKTNLPRYQTILERARARDRGEADTVTIVRDMLADIFGYNKYEDIDAEQGNRGTSADLAVKVDEVVQAFIKVKPIGTDIKESHAKLAIDNAVQQGVGWAILTNGRAWRVYNVVAGETTSTTLVVDVDLDALTADQAADIDTLFLWCKEGWQKSALIQYQDQIKALSRFTVGQALLSDSVLSSIRKELGKMNPNANLEIEQIAAVMRQEVVRPELIKEIPGNTTTAGVATPAPGADKNKGAPADGHTRRPSVGLFELGLSVGAQLFFESSDLFVTVESNRKVLMGGVPTSLSAAASKAGEDLGRPATGSPMLYWRYEGESLEERRVRLGSDGMSNQGEGENGDENGGEEEGGGTDPDHQEVVTRVDSKTGDE